MRVSCRVACQVPIPTAGFRRRALFRETLSPIKSDASFSGRVGLPPESIVMPSSSPLQPGGGAEFYATVPTGLADSREPTLGLLPGLGGSVRSRDRMGVPACIRFCLPTFPN